MSVLCVCPVLEATPHPITFPQTVTRAKTQRCRTACGKRQTCGCVVSVVCWGLVAVVVNKYCSIAYFSASGVFGMDAVECVSRRSFNAVSVKRVTRLHVTRTHTPICSDIK